MTITPPISYTAKWIETGPIAAADNAWLFTPRRPPAGGSPLVFYCHGLVISWPHPWPAVPDPVDTRMTIIGRLCAVGATVLMPAISDPTVLTGTTSANGFGNATNTARLEAWRVWAAANIANVKAAKVSLLADSMGNYTSLGYARDYRSKVNAVAAYCPYCDAVQSRTVRDGLAATIEAAWGITSGSATPAGLDLLTHSGTANVPWRGYYKTDDTVIATTAPLAVASVLAMAAHTGGTAVSKGTGGHDTNQWGDVNWDEFYSWFAPYLWA